MDKGLINKKQREILSYLKKEILEKGYPPSVREICTAVGLKSTSSVHAHLEALEKHGYIKKDATKPRAIEILDDIFQEQRLERISGAEEPISDTQDNLVEVPIIGEVAAGQPLLEVKGESMVNVGILDGDYVLVEQKSTAGNGEMVVALVDDSATVKTFYKEDGYYRLQPENDFMEPIIVKGELQILGKVIGVLRFMG